MSHSHVVGPAALPGIAGPRWVEVQDGRIAKISERPVFLAAHLFGATAGPRHDAPRYVLAGGRVVAESTAAWSTVLGS